MRILVIPLIACCLALPTTAQATIVVNATEASGSVENANFTPSAPDAQTQTANIGTTGFQLDVSVDPPNVANVQGSTTLNGNGTSNAIITGSTRILANTLSMFPSDFFGTGGCSTGASCPVIFSVNLGLRNSSNQTSNGTATPELRVTVFAVDSFGNSLPNTVVTLNQEGNNPARAGITPQMGEIVTGVQFEGINGFKIVETKQIRLRPEFFFSEPPAVPEPHSFIPLALAIMATASRRTKRPQRGT